MFNAIAVREAAKSEILPVRVYDKNKAWGLYTSVDIHNCNPEYIRDQEIIKQYVLQLSEILKLECFGATRIVNVGTENQCEGCSMTQFVDSSLVSGHFSYSSNTAFIDIFSCKYYDPEVISHFTLSFFKGTSYTLNVTVRK